MKSLSPLGKCLAFSTQRPTSSKEKEGLCSLPRQKMQLKKAKEQGLPVEGKKKKNNVCEVVSRKFQGAGLVQSGMRRERSDS